ncbi:MAG: SAM-dependent methyltransferase [Candidatus Dactylopiibacterium carminicum]|uniref:Chemotaxis protein methyltransferase n=1 Tax=Candidatus Dactylopiibacterium carminicum TaxID=857335 RepID=A0A272EUQ9_9RHOO|nr:CheR family methyltransferase [Candidatus Dactylopiibacterium carminicum]KAF7600386.1 SAM-dependent methyltransferase [Candidatus Dactylopiibacterium carminicum]PAS93786.1 MAG: SAM-dependent methyltransferase [Candidatus Dactylopiibacterium carminicum]PAS96824.1 MAG: SAM-dependent methyltransferase [Candidatus Dactylopiibacterium carminicum]PAT00386.1 MAG: hypothetical protein BSR46_03150 [Candidatus Dactylopiibacterium carminicum]
MNTPCDIPALQLSERSFGLLRSLFEKETGIHLRGEKRHLVIGRLQRRLEQRGLHDFESYCALLQQPHETQERQHLIDALTTHETYFFREPAHFQHLREQALPNLETRPLRIWSAASSSGEEAYSLAMTLADTLGPDGWEVFASDVSACSVWQAIQGLYPQQRLDNMPKGYLKRFCRRGQGVYTGQMLIHADLRARVNFFRHNLLADDNKLGEFAVVFLRNALIYFDATRRGQIIGKVVRHLRPGGYLYLGQSESFSEPLTSLEYLGGSIYRRPSCPAIARST